MTRIRRVLCATDFSAASRPAFAGAVDLAKASRARLLVLHVLVPPSPLRGDELPASYLELEAAARRAAERRLAAAVARARDAGVRVDGELAPGFPADVIARSARRWRADVIVIGTHGRTGLGRVFMGSVASRVLTEAACPVLTIRGR